MESEKTKNRRSRFWQKLTRKKDKSTHEDDLAALSRSLGVTEKDNLPSSDYTLGQHDMPAESSEFVVLRSPTDSSAPNLAASRDQLNVQSHDRNISTGSHVSQQDVLTADRAIADIQSDLRKSYLSTASSKRSPTPFATRSPEMATVAENSFSPTSIGQAVSSNPDSPTTGDSRHQRADEYIQQAITFHEADRLDEATNYFKLAADEDSPLGNFLYGLSLRHGWGCKANPALAVHYLQRAAESAVFELHTALAKTTATPSTANTKLIARHELVLAIYEIGQSFYRGWGVPKQKKLAIHYFEIAASLGDPDAQNALADCLYKGDGVKRDKKKAARYYRMAAAQGAGLVGNSWIYKSKYLDEGEELPEGVVA